MRFKKWRWIIVQGFLMGLILLLPSSQHFSIPELGIILLRSIEIFGFIIGFIAMYNLRHSFSIAPQPIPTGRLEVHGIYAYIRHPMYSAVFLIFFGISLLSEDLRKVILFVLLITFFVIKIKYEELFLQEKYTNYREYKGKVGMILPKITK